MATTKQAASQKTSKSKEFTQAPSEQLSASTGESFETEGKCESAIREKAYLLWEAAGYPAGDGVDFWIQAEQALSAESEACL